MSEIYDLTLSTLTYGGEAMGRLPDGRAAFVPLALPGETVRAQVVESKRGFARLRLLEVLQASPRRIAPRCRHFGECGGCHYQHMPYEDQLAAKTAIVRDQLARIGRIPDPPVQPAIGSPNPYYYRNHIQFALDENGKLGYHRLRSASVLPIQECHLPEDMLNQVWPQLDFEALPEIERVGLRLGVEDDVQLILESSAIEAPEFDVEGLSLSAAHLSPAGTLTLAGSPYLWMEVLERLFRVSAGAFFQVNSAQAAAMVQHVLSLLEQAGALSPRSTLLDVYCGVGLFSAFLAGRCGRLIGIEVSPAACEDFEANLDEFENVELYEAAAEDVLPALRVFPDALVIDPPREGIDKRALDAIVQFSAPHLIYVSCDPSTLARDAQRLLAGGYTLIQTTPFDLFPQTFHIETISWFRKS
jgi:23S rRNA (uracil1939-C5)-methyltransferase